MPDFARVDHAQKTPTACLTCTGTVGPFVDLVRELPGYGRVYLCETCSWDVGRKFGMVDRLEAGRLEARIAALEGKLTEAQEAVEKRRDVREISERSLRAVIGDVVGEQIGRLVTVPAAPDDAPAPLVAAGAGHRVRRRHGRQ